MRPLFLMDSLQKVSPVFKSIPVFALTLGLVATLGITGCNEDQAVLQPAISKLLEKANELKKAEQPTEALCRLKAAEDLAPDVYQVQYNMGALLSEQKQWYAAIEHLEKALKIKPGDPSALYTLGYTYQNLGDEYAKGLQLAPYQKPSELVKGLSPEQLQEEQKDAYTKAITTYEKFLKDAPSNDPSRKDVESQLSYLQTQVKTPLP